MPTLEDFYFTPFVNDRTKITVMHMGWKTTGNWYEDKILEWAKRQIKAVWYDKKANELDVVIDESKEDGDAEEGH